MLHTKQTNERTDEKGEREMDRKRETKTERESKGRAANGWQGNHNEEQLASHCHERAAEGAVRECGAAAGGGRGIILSASRDSSRANQNVARTRLAAGEDEA